MKVLLYFQDEKAIKTSGIGRARAHQMRALSEAGVSFTTNPQDDFDIAHINTIWGKSQRLLARCHRKGIPVIVHGHSTYEDFRNSFRCWKMVEPYFDRQLKKMYSRADLIITPTPYSKKLIEGYGFAKKVIDISNGIDAKEYALDLNAQKRFKEMFGIKDGEKFVIGIGFPFERKGLHDFFAVARKFPHTKFIWFGHLAKILTSSKMLKAIRERPDNALMPGYIAGDLIHGALQLATCLFFPSYEETEGIVVLEALASKCPLVLRDIGVYDPWIKDGVNGHLCKNNEDFERTIRSLMEKGEKKSIIAKGFQTAKDRSIANIGAKLKEAYESVLSFNR